MNPDRHIYIATAVVALVISAAISVLAPRSPFAGNLALPEVSGASVSRQPSPNKVDVSATSPAAPQRRDASL